MSESATVREQMIREAVLRVGWNASGYIMPANQARWLLKQNPETLLWRVRAEYRRVLAQDMKLG